MAPTEKGRLGWARGLVGGGVVSCRGPDEEECMVSISGEHYSANEYACLTEVILHTAPPGSGPLITTISIIWQSSVVGGSMNHHGHM